MGHDHHTTFENGLNAIRWVHCVDAGFCSNRLYGFPFHGQHRRSSNGCSSTSAQRSSLRSTASDDPQRPRDLELLSRSSGTGAPRKPYWLHRPLQCLVTASPCASRRILTLTPSRPGRPFLPVRRALRSSIFCLSHLLCHYYGSKKPSIVLRPFSRRIY